MDHRAFLVSLDTARRRHLTARSDLIGLVHLAGHWGAILSLSALVVLKVPGWPFLMLPLGILLVFLFTLMHEAAHFTPFASQWINRVVSHTCGLILFLPANWFRYFHMAHHRHTQDPDRDPELATPKPSNVWQYIVHVSGIPVYRGHLTAILRNAFFYRSEPYLPRSASAKLKLEARLMLAFYGGVFTACIALNLHEILIVWLVPLLLGQPFLRLYLLAEHAGCPQDRDMFANTRTVQTNWFIRKLAWNMPYHAEHHAYPTVPFHRLDELHQLTRPHLKVTAPGYAHFNRQFIASL